MPSRRVLRVASRLKFLISAVIQRDLRDPRLGFLTILDVEPTEDFKEAKVRFSVLGSRGERSKALHALEDARGYIQKKIAKNLRLRNTPALRFILAEEETKASRLDELLEQARRDAEGRPPSGDAEGLSGDVGGPSGDVGGPSGDVGGPSGDVGPSGDAGGPPEEIDDGEGREP